MKVASDYLIVRMIWSWSLFGFEAELTLDGMFEPETRALQS